MNGEALAPEVGRAAGVGVDRADLGTVADALLTGGGGLEWLSAD